MTHEHTLAHIYLFGTSTNSIVAYALQHYGPSIEIEIFTSVHYLWFLHMYLRSQLIVLHHTPKIDGS